MIDYTLIYTKTHNLIQFVNKISHKFIVIITVLSIAGLAEQATKTVPNKNKRVNFILTAFIRKSKEKLIF